MGNNKAFKFVDTGIVSSKLPISTHLIWEVSSSLLFLVDSNDGTKVYKSVDKGANWTQVDVDPSDSSGDNKSRDHNIRSAWHDRTNGLIYFVDCDNDGTADDFDVWKMTTDGNETVTEIGTSVGQDVNTVYAHDIFMIGANVYVMNREFKDAHNDLVVWDVDTAPFVQQDRLDAGDWTFQSSYLGVVDGNIFYNVLASTTGSFVMGISYDHSITTIAFGDHNTQKINTTISSLSQNGMAYDGDDILQFSGDVSGTEKLITWSISEDAFTEFGEYNIALMLDRNCSNTVPNEMEKAFSIAKDENNLSYIYEIKPRKGGIIQLQTIKEE